MVNQNLKGPGQCSGSCLFLAPLSGLFCALVQILISQMNTNIDSVDVWAPVTSDAFQLFKFFVAAAGCNAQKTRPRPQKLGQQISRQLPMTSHRSVTICQK